MRGISDNSVRGLVGRLHSAGRSFLGSTVVLRGGGGSVVIAHSGCIYRIGRWVMTVVRESVGSLGCLVGCYE